MEKIEPVYTSGLPVALCVWETAGEDRVRRSGCGRVSRMREAEGG